MMSAVMEQRPPVMLSAAAGDASAFSQLIEPLLDPAFRLAAVMLADRAAAEDAVQEASIKAWRKLRQLRGDERSLRSWFLSIVANECRMARRQRWWSVVKLAEPPRSDAEAADQYSGAASDVRRALLRLKPQDRLPLVLHFYLDFPLDEVARTLGVSEAAAKSRIYRAAKTLRPDLSLEEVF
jgi:RNA polymerase sigma-70 factor, ECF subfamily